MPELNGDSIDSSDAKIRATVSIHAHNASMILCFPYLALKQWMWHHFLSIRRGYVYTPTVN